MVSQSKQHKSWDSRKPAKEAGYVHVISIPWQGQKNYWWNEACADIIEVFGLPGGRFTSHPSHDKMDFYFKSQKDADLCRIMLSEKL
jgi:hypothetical protein